MVSRIGSLLILIVFLFVVTVSSVAQEIPVLVQTNSNAKVMFIIDDSGSMNALMESSDFDPTSAAATNTANDIPSIIFRLQSGASAPATTQTLTPVLIEENAGFSNSSTGSLYAGATFSNYASIPVVAAMSCNNSSGNNTNCTAPGATTPQTGTNAAMLYGNSSIVGNSIFQLTNLAKTGSTYITDASGNEYLYLKYRKNDYANLTDNFGDVWAKFDASGNPLNYFTRVFSTAGGTVKFNGKEVFLSAGWYRIEYLRWIFYAATSAQLAKLPGTSRLATVKQVAQSMIVNNPTVKFGLATLNGSNFLGTHSGNLFNQWYYSNGDANNTKPKIRNAIGTAQATLISSLNTMAPAGGTPLTNTYIEALKYMHGESGYTSPFTSTCDGHFVILLTDGLPTTETANSMFGSYILDYDGDASEGATSNNNCQSVSNKRCYDFADDAAYYAYHTADFSSTLTGQQIVKTYTIGLGIDYSLLQNIASKGGTGQAYIANSVQEVTDALKNIVTLIVTSATSGAGAALAETFGDEGRVYRPRFNADRWTGNIDAYKYTSATDTLDFLFDMADVLEQRNLATDPRNIIVGYDPDHDGKTNQTLAFTTSNASTLRPELFQLFIDGTSSPTLLEPPIADYTVDASASTLISYIQGNENSEFRDRDRDQSGGTADLGDIVYSRPVEVGPKNGNYNTFTGYTDFTASLSSQPRILLVGANDGMLHAFNVSTGRELWAYIPSSVVKYLELLSRVPYNGEYRKSFVDGPITVEDVYQNGAWRTLAMFGLRTGGAAYTVLDITDRSNPTLVWEVSDQANGGDSWSKPAVVLSNGTGNSPGTYTWYMVVGTGENKATAGTNILSYNLASTTPPTPTVTAISAADPIGTRTSGVVAVQDDADLAVDRLYLGTEEGDLFRVKVTGLATAWTVQKLYDGGNTQPIVASPIAILVDNPQYTGAGSGVGSFKYAAGIYFGTGRYDALTDVTGVGATSQRIIGIFDPVNTTDDTYGGVLTNLTTTNLQNQSVATFSVVRGATDGIYRVPSTKAGFYIDMATTISVASNFIGPTGMVVYEPANLRGNLLFASFLPNQGTCAVGGHGFVEAVNYRTGGGTIVDNTDPSAPFFNGGIPDVDGNNLYNATDVTLGVQQEKILPVMDVKVESIDLTQTKPYAHSNTLTKDDIRLHSTNGGILPAVSSLGNRGVPVTPSILKGAHRIIVQPAYVEPPKTGNPDDGDGGGQQTPPSATVPGPDMLPMRIYDLPIRVISFHEPTGG